MNFLRFRAATRISRVNCAEMAGVRPRQPAYEIFSIECRFQQSKSGPSIVQRGLRAHARVKEGYPTKSGYLSAVGLFGVKMVADRNRHGTSTGHELFRNINIDALE